MGSGITEHSLFLSRTVCFEACSIPLCSNTSRGKEKIRFLHHHKIHNEMYLNHISCKDGPCLSLLWRSHILDSPWLHGAMSMSLMLMIFDP